MSSFHVFFFCFIFAIFSDLLNVGTFLGIGRQHVGHQRPEVLGVLCGHGRELPLDDLAREAIKAARPTDGSPNGREGREGGREKRSTGVGS